MPATALLAPGAIGCADRDGNAEREGNSPEKALARHSRLPDQRKNKIMFRNSWFPVGPVARPGAYSEALMYKPGFIILKPQAIVLVGRIFIFPCVFLDRI